MGFNRLLQLYKDLEDKFERIGGYTIPSSVIPRDSTMSIITVSSILSPEDLGDGFRIQEPYWLLCLRVLGFFITVYYGNLETIPYTKRRHFVLLSRAMERSLGESQFEQMKAAFKGKILPAVHPESVRVRLIAKDIIDALQRGLKQENVWSDLGYASEAAIGAPEGSGNETLMALRDSGAGKMEGKWYREDEILDDKWVERSRKKVRNRGPKQISRIWMD
ncbi:hypothetical protein SDJN03_24344, partial [Cucurbita argyrosperma subsp. sororia]